MSLVVYWYTNSGLIRYSGPNGSDRGPTALTELVERTERPNGPTCDGMKMLSIHVNHETSWVVSNHENLIIMKIVPTHALLFVVVCCCGVCGIAQALVVISRASFASVVCYRMVEPVGKDDMPSDMLALALINVYPQDCRIKFVEGSHTYWLDGDVRFPISVSGVWSKFFDKFDADSIVDTYFGSWACNPASRYYALICCLRAEGRCDVEIKACIIAGWQEAGRAASADGTTMHRQIELLLNNVPCEASTVEIGQFHKFMEEFVEPRGWRAYRTEWSIYDERRMIAGQIDCVFRCVRTGEFHMVDWKRCKKALDRKSGSEYGRTGMPPCDFLVDNQFSHYAAQQNLYAALLLDNYGLRISSMWLAQFHPLHHGYTVHSVPVFLSTAREMLDICAVDAGACHLGCGCGLVICAGIGNSATSANFVTALPTRNAVLRSGSVSRSPRRLRSPP
jgi:hypothetical protein